MNRPIELLKKYWNYDRFKDPQEAVINSVLSNKDTLALLPTGGGKSVCYQLPALLNKGICIVISPLIALMQDQVAALELKGIKSVFLASDLSTNELNIAFDNLLYGNYKFLYLSPEKLQSPFIKEKIKHLTVSLIAVDEAHCISEWGHDFRPSYLKINELKELHPTVPVLALTATATHQVIEDIKRYLNLNNPQLFKKSFYRENIAFQVIHIEDKIGKLKQVLEKISAPTIIYVRNRKTTKELSSKLTNLGFKSNYYHGGLTFEQKKDALNSWLTESSPIMVATNAFGMGIDKANVRLIIHLDVPGSIENFIQEAGRSGRDGRKSFSILLIDDADYYKSEQQLLFTLPSIKIIKEVYYKLNQYFKIPYGDWVQEALTLNIEEFSTRYDFNKNQVYNVLKMLESVEIIQLDENINRKSTVTFLTNNNDLFTYIDAHKELGKVIQLLLRSYGGIVDFTTNIHESYLAKKLSITENQIIELLKRLVKDEIITYEQASVHIQLTFLVPREDEKTVYLKSNQIKFRNERKLQKLNDIIQFLKNDNVCRSIQILNYFGEEKVEKCNTCDVCLRESSKNNPQHNLDLDKTLINLLKNKSLNLNELVDYLEIDRKKLTTTLQLLIEKDIIGLNLQHQFYLKK